MNPRLVVIGMVVVGMVALAGGACSLGYEPGQVAGGCTDCGTVEEPCTADTMCDDGAFCNGVERCDPADPGADADGCVPGPDVVSDGLDCTEDVCDEATATVSHLLTDACQCQTDGDCIATTTVDPSCGTVYCGDAYVCEVDYRPAGAPCIGLDCQINAQCDGLGKCFGGADDSVCDDHLVCNGVEHCRPERDQADDRGCVHSRPPDVHDDLGCTDDVCVECAPTDTDCQKQGHAVRHDIGGPCDAEGAVCVEATVGICMEAICVDGLWTLQPQPAGAGCDDGVACTVRDACDGHGACGGQPDHTACDDRTFCNGAELCDPTHGCVAGPRPDLADPTGRACTHARCDEGADRVYWSPAACGGRVTADLVAFYPFVEGAGNFAHNLAPSPITALDLRRRGNGLRWLTGRSGVSVDGASGQILATNVSATPLLERLNAGGAFTIELWFKPRDLVHAGPDRIVTFSADPTHSNFTLGQEQAHLALRLRGAGANDAGMPQLLYRDALTLDEVHVVVTWSAGAIRLYKNGSVVAEEATTTRTDALAAFNGDYKLALGNELTLDRQWEGDLFLVAVYARALTAAEVRRHFSAGSAP